jgi:hypothetical protein
VSLCGFRAPHLLPLWILKETGEIRNKENLFKEINQYISDRRAYS